MEVLVRLATHVRNARVTRLAREAVDVGGHGVLVLDAQSRLQHANTIADQMLVQGKLLRSKDGSIGLHIEDPRGSMFVTATCYVAMRMLGLSAEDERAQRMRHWMRAAMTRRSWKPS